jgi:hypothetical protein
MFQSEDQSQMRPDDRNYNYFPLLVHVVLRLKP